MLKELGNQVTIWTDFNLVLNPDLDTKNYININNPKAREKVLDICEEFNLIDVWRESYPEEKKYTWRTSNGNKQARLDFFLISENIYTLVEQVNIEPSHRSDHIIVTLKIGKRRESTNRTFWKSNNSLLKDTEYVKIVILEIRKQYVHMSHIQTVIMIATLV